ncbi:hypothetical protein F1C16_07600 [Hymenobacter sp. NBH84]|uniref:hypothetical protein n=1 Tax=Hymenobacter sp. NBH84 TaxID=2596915 RepID=UPI001628AB40|nr:hypothetical protein [Hymenobacter sp. NBH84]QNE39428.1 hypothetical protein F1C16_07600 [Hymenobacter sp. NBH84]
MNHDAALAFYQQFYADLTLYVVPEVGEEKAAPIAKAAAPQPAQAPTPAPATPVPPTPLAAAPVPPPATPLVAAPTPPVSRPAASVPPVTPLISRPPVTVPSSAPTPPPAPPVTRIAPLAAPAPPQRTAPPLTQTPFSTLGSNARGIVILVRLDAVKFQRLPRHVFLNNVLKAIGQIVEDTVLINVESHLPVALSTLRTKLEAKQIIGFGKNLLDVAVHKTQLYEPVILVGDAAYLPAAELDVIEEDQGRKKLLWNAMKRMFL